MGMLIGIVIVSLCAFGIYFFPTIIANGRGHQDQVAIFIFNFGFGWTVIGWIVLLVWAFMPTRVKFERTVLKSIKVTLPEKGDDFSDIVWH